MSTTWSKPPRNSGQLVISGLHTFVYFPHIVRTLLLKAMAGSSRWHALFFFFVKEVQSVLLYAQQNCSAAMLKIVQRVSFILLSLLYFILAVLVSLRRHFPTEAKYSYYCTCVGIPWQQLLSLKLKKNKYFCLHYHAAPKSLLWLMNICHDNAKEMSFKK